MERVSFSMTIAPQHVSQYVRMHTHPWPELLAALERSGWHDYSLFLGADQLLVGWLRADDWGRSASVMAAEPVSSAWSVEMDRLVDPRFPLEYTEPIVLRQGRSPEPRRRCAFVRGGSLDSVALASQLGHAPASAAWSELAVIDTVRGPALYGEHAPGVVLPWPVSEVVELRQIFYLPDLLAHEEGTRP
jgi:L-rhamnose mutarotase